MRLLPVVLVLAVSACASKSTSSTSGRMSDPNPRPTSVGADAPRVDTSTTYAKPSSAYESRGVDEIRRRLADTPGLSDEARQTRVDFREGRLCLRGNVADQTERDKVVALVRESVDYRMIDDGLEIYGGAGVSPQQPQPQSPQPQPEQPK
jgi:hypothetical protein